MSELLWFLLILKEHLLWFRSQPRLLNGTQRCGRRANRRTSQPYIASTSGTQEGSPTINSVGVIQPHNQAMQYVNIFLWSAQIRDNDHKQEASIDIPPEWKSHDTWSGFFGSGTSIIKSSIRGLEASTSTQMRAWLILLRVSVALSA